MKFKLNDQVKITMGKDKGKTGPIRRIFPALNKVVVEGLNLYKKHLKPQATGSAGKIISKERPFYTASIALLCPKCKKPTRVHYHLDKTGEKHRLCAKCNYPLDKKPKTK